MRVTLHQNGRTEMARARYLVASDGGRSPIRKTLSVEMGGSTFEEPWLIVDLKDSANRNRHTEVLCDPVRPCISLPGPRRHPSLRIHASQGRGPRGHGYRGPRCAICSPRSGRTETRRYGAAKSYTFHAPRCSALAGRACPFWQGNGRAPNAALRRARYE